MPLLAPKVRFEHRVKWSIRNFQMCPSWTNPLANLVITSPEFEIRLLDVITLKFSLMTEVPGKSMWLNVHFVGSGGAEQCLFFTLGVAIPGAEKLAPNEPRALAPKMQLPIPGVMGSYLLRGVYPGMRLNDGTLILHLALKMSVRQGPYWSPLLDPHLLALSTDLDSMVTRPSYTDYVVESNEGVRFDVHSCILRVRMPVLFQEEKTSNPSSDAGPSDSDAGSTDSDAGPSDSGAGSSDSGAGSCDSGAGSSDSDASSSDSDGQPKKVDVPCFKTGMSTKASRTLIFYLYGRLASTIPENQRVELLNFAKNNKLKDLESMLRSYPLEYSLETSLVVEDMCFNIDVADMWENKIPKTWISRNIRTAASWTITPDQSIAVTFLLDSDPQAPIPMKCTVSLKSRSDQEMKEHVIWHTFTKDKAWTTPTFSLVDVHSISCKVQMTEVRLDQKIELTMEDERGSQVVFNNLRNLSEQIEKLYVDQVGCDLELHVGSTVFHVHKAIVVARSPMIRLMVKEKEKEPMDPRVVMIKMREFPPEYYNDVIIYMYSGRIEPKSPNYMYAVAEVADYLDMPFLMDLCYFLEQ